MQRFTTSIGTRVLLRLDRVISVTESSDGKNETYITIANGKSGTTFFKVANSFDEVSELMKQWEFENFEKAGREIMKLVFHKGFHSIPSDIRNTFSIGVHNMFYENYNNASPFSPSQLMSELTVFIGELLRSYLIKENKEEVQ